MKLVSVLMSMYLEPVEYIRLAVESILRQTYYNIQFVVIADGPINIEAIEYIKQRKQEDKRIKLIINECNIGLVASLNKGLMSCDGYYIARMDADDISEPERIQKQIQFLEQNQLDMIGCSFDTFVEVPEKSEGVNIVPCTDIINRRLSIEPCLAHPTWFGRKEIFTINQGYRNIFACEDYDFLVRAYMGGFKLGNCQEVLLMYRLNPKSISHQHAMKQKVTFKFLSKNFKMGRSVPIEKYNDFINGQEYADLHRAYNYVFMMKNGKGIEQIKGCVCLLSKINILRTYLKYK